MRAYKIEILVIDFDEVGEAGIFSELENANYANDCIAPKVMNSAVADIGKWSDEHPLNNTKTSADEYARLFQ